MLSLMGSVLAFADLHGQGLAAIAALIGIPALFWQIFQGARQERRRLRARRLAALSTLPITLTGINTWAKDVSRSLTAIYPWAKRRAGNNPPPEFKPPASPDHLIGAIERMIEAEPKDRIAKTLAAIVAEIQVLHSRISDVDEFSPGRIDGQEWSIDDNLLKAATIYALASSLYDDARKLSDDHPRNFPDIASALNIMNVRDGNHDEVHRMLATAAEKDRRNRRWFYEKWWEWVSARPAKIGGWWTRLWAKKEHTAEWELPDTGFDDQGNA